jgi:hypothetical protein
VGVKSKLNNDFYVHEKKRHNCIKTFFRKTNFVEKEQPVRKKFFRLFSIYKRTIFGTKKLETLKMEFGRESDNLIKIIL